MALKMRMRRALGRPSDSSSTTASSSGSNADSSSPTSTSPSSSSSSTTDLSTVLTRTATTQQPGLTLTKTASRLSAKLKGWRSSSSSNKRDKNLLWVEPRTKYPGACSKHQEMLRSFELKFGRSADAGSIYSGVSPMASRRCSVVDLPPSHLESGLASSVVAGECDDEEDVYDEEEQLDGSDSEEYVVVEHREHVLAV